MMMMIIIIIKMIMNRALITESETEIKQTDTHGFSGNPVFDQKKC